MCFWSPLPSFLLLCAKRHACSLFHSDALGQPERKPDPKAAIKAATLVTQRLSQASARAILGCPAVRPMEIPGPGAPFCRLIRPRESNGAIISGARPVNPNAQCLNDDAFAWFPRTHHAMRRTSRALNRARARTFGRATRAGLGCCRLISSCHSIHTG